MHARVLRVVAVRSAHAHVVAYACVRACMLLSARMHVLPRTLASMAHAWVCMLRDEHAHAWVWRVCAFGCACVLSIAYA